MSLPIGLLRKQKSNPQYSEAFHSPIKGLVSVALVLMRFMNYDARDGC